jgi:hypothetical protein
VLDELTKMVGALDDEIVRYLSFHFNDENVVAGRSVLLGLEAGQSMVRMGKVARNSQGTSCTKPAGEPIIGDHYSEQSV